jgi:hypothetical protein
MSLKQDQEIYNDIIEPLMLRSTILSQENKWLLQLQSGNLGTYLPNNIGVISIWH